MRVVYEPVEDGVGQCRVVHCLVPVSHRQLACGHGRTASVSVIQQLEQVLLLGCRQLRQPPIVQYKDVDASHLLEQLQIATVAVCNGQVFEQAWQPVVADREAFEASLVGECARHVAFADAGRAGNDDVLMTSDPVATGQGQHESPVKAAPGAIVQILHTGRLSQPCPSQP